jgi:hypothetical protein
MRTQREMTVWGVAESDFNAMYKQLCLAQSIRKQFLDHATSPQWKERVRFDINDVFIPKQYPRSAGPSFVCNTWIELPIGKWRFAQLHTLLATNDTQDAKLDWYSFWDQFFKKIPVELDTTAREVQNYKYAIKGVDSSMGEPCLLTPEKAEAVWAAMKVKYAREHVNKK